jgi:serine/threonine protein kinase
MDGDTPSCDPGTPRIRLRSGADQTPACCPHTSTILELLNDADATSKSLGALAEHLEICPLCIAELESRLGNWIPGHSLNQLRQVVGTLTRSCTPPPPLVELASDPNPHAIPGDGYANRLIDRLVGNARSLLPEKTPGEILLDFLTPPREPGELGWLGPFRVRAVLGQGGMGLVLAAEDPLLDRPLALKVLRPGMGRLPEARERFLREARALAAIQHPQVVTIHQIGEAADVIFLAMERLEGETLEQRLQAGQPPSLVEILQVGWQTAQGLAAAHARGLIHRDLKPANIFLARPPVGDGSAFTVKILDFGLARLLAAASLTESGLFLGTPAYAAPEQLEDQPIDHRADLFALGAILYRLVAGRPAFPGDRVLTVMRSLALDQPPTLQSVNPAAPLALSTLVGQLLSKDPGARPGSALEVAEHLQGILKDLQDRDPRIEKRESKSNKETADSSCLKPRISKSSKSSILLLLAAGVAVLLLLGGYLASSSHGWLEIESDDPDVKILVEDAGGKVTLLDLKSQHTLRLPPGAFHLWLWPDSDSSLETDSFVLKRGDNILIQVKRIKSELREWMARVAGLPADKQVEAVVERLKQRNPGFVGRVKSATRDGKVVRLELRSDHVVDLSPLRALPDLEWLACSGSGPGTGRLQDLTPLQGLPLVRLDVSDTQVADLSPLRGLKLDTLILRNTRIIDLKPLEGMPLCDLFLSGTRVRDLTALQGLRTLRVLDVSSIPVTTLEPLRGIPIATLDCSWTSIKNLEPLRGSILNRLAMQATPVRDLSVLGSLKHLASLEIDPDHPELSLLQNIPSLERINFKTPEQFWKEINLSSPGSKR